MKVWLYALAIVLLLVVMRAASEFGMMSAHGPDAQMAIWELFMIVQLIFWLVTGLVAAALLTAAWSNRWRSIAAGALLLAWAIAISWSSASYYDAGRVLIDASDPSLSPDRLRELASYSGMQAG